MATSTIAVETGGEDNSSSATHATSRRWPFAVIAGLIALATLGLRLFHIRSAYEVFIDETEYTNIARSIISGHGVDLFGSPFYLHPPLYFLLLAPAVGLRLPATPLDLLLDVRYVNTIFAVANVTLVMLLARRARGLTVAVIAGCLYALNPFIIKFDSRVTLETSMLTWILLGWWLLTLTHNKVGRQRITLLVAAGISWGLALLTKETSALVTFIPLALFAVTGRVLPRRDLLKVSACQIGVYAVYVLFVAVFGGIGAWWTATTGGIARALGFLQVSGYNSAHAPTFVSRLVANGATFLPAYLVLLAGSVAAVFLVIANWARWSATALRTTADPQRDTTAMLSLWHVAICLTLGYTVLFGTLEEQTFYLIAVPATITSALGLSLIAQHRRAAARWAAITSAALIFAWSGVSWGIVHFSRDDTYARFQSWAQNALPPGSKIGLTEDTGQFVLSGFTMTKVSSLQNAETSVRYVLVSTSLIQQGFGEASPQFLDQLDRSFTIVHVERGSTLGELRLYDLDAPKPGS